MQDQQRIRDNNGRFVHGHRKLSKRTVGVANKLTRDIKQGMMQSAIEHGRNGRGLDGLPGFCAWLLANDLKSWCSIFARMVPLDLHAEVSHHNFQVNVVSIPRGRFFTKDEARKVLAGELDLIDVTPAPIADDVTPMTASPPPPMPHHAGNDDEPSPSAA
jgi:hypothetical protein